jgi:hypothetical protein
MKRFILFFILILPIYGYSQITVITTNGDTIVSPIKSILGKNIQFYHKINSQGHLALPISLVSEIHGTLPNYRLQILNSVNPNIKYFDDLIMPKTSFQQKEISITSSKLEKDGGDLVKLSAQLRLTGFAIGTGASIVVAIANIGYLKNDLNFKKIDEMTDYSNKFNKRSKTLNTISIISGVTAIGFYIAGESVQIRAGEKLKNKPFALGFSEEGIGLALKF